MRGYRQIDRQMRDRQMRGYRQIDRQTGTDR